MTSLVTDDELLAIFTKRRKIECYTDFLKDRLKGWIIVYISTLNLSTLNPCLVTGAEEVIPVKQTCILIMAIGISTNLKLLSNTARDLTVCVGGKERSEEY